MSINYAAANHKAQLILAYYKGTKKHYKTEKVLKHLLTHKRGLTSMTAFERYDLTRLGSIIYELRHKWGLPIITIREVSKDGQTYARYVLDLEEESA